MQYAGSERGAVSKKLLVFFVVFLVIMGGLALFSLLGPKDPYRETADKFVTALVSKDASGSYALLTDRLKKEVSASTWEKQLQSAPTYEEPTFVSNELIDDPENLYGETGEPHKVTYTFHFPDLGDGNVTFRLSLVIINKSEVLQIDEIESVEL